MKTPIVYRKISGMLEEMGYTRRALADYLGVTYGTLHNKLSKLTPFTWDEVKLIAEYLAWDKPLDTLMKEYPRKNARRQAEPGAGATETPGDGGRAYQQ